MMSGWINSIPRFFVMILILLYIACKTIVSFADDVDDGKNIFIALFIMFSLTGSHAATTE
jgi:hypothetical protein